MRGAPVRCAAPAQCYCARGETEAVTAPTGALCCPPDRPGALRGAPGRCTSAVSRCAGATGRLQASLRPKVSLCPSRILYFRPGPAVGRSELVLVANTRGHSVDGGVLSRRSPPQKKASPGPAAMARKRMRSRADALAKPAASARAVQHAAPAKEHREAAVAAQRRASEKKPRLEKIRGLESELLAQGSSKANNLVELLESLRSEDTVVAKAALHSLRRLFTCGCAALDAAMRPAAAAAAAADADEADAPDAAAKAANIYDTWIRDRYADYKQDLLARLAGTAKELQTVSMVVMLQLAKQESAAPGGDGLAVGTLTQVLRTLLLRTSHNADAVLKMFVRNFASEYDDVRFHVLKAAKAVLGGLRQQSTDSEALEAVHRALTLLLSVRIPEATRERLDNFWFSLEGETSDQGPKKKQKTTSEPRGKRVTQVRSHRKAFADCWMELLQIRGLDVASYRRVLLGMHDQILPHLPHPLLLSDFLTDAYNHGGAVSMLAMHGLFILMAKHGLEYPQFYPRLYALMTPSIFHLAHRDQFFRLTDLFLTSKGAQPVGVCCC
jgi:hypothetical protein